MTTTRPITRTSWVSNHLASLSMMTKVTLEDVKKIADSIGDMMIMTKIMTKTMIMTIKTKLPREMCRR